MIDRKAVISFVQIDRIEHQVIQTLARIMKESLTGFKKTVLVLINPKSRLLRGVK